MRLRIFSLVLLIVFIPLSVTGCLLFDDSDYYKGANWHYTEEEFRSEYLPYVFGVVEELKLKYGIECNKQFEMTLYYDGDDFFNLYLYSNEFTVSIDLNGGATSYSKTEISLFYFGSGEKSIYDYENQRYLVDFTNELIQRLCLGVEQYPDGLPFENAFYKCSEENLPFYSEELHFDDMIGEVGFTVQFQSKAFGKYHNMSEDEHTDILCNEYSFEGILKAAPKAEGERA